MNGTFHSTDAETVLQTLLYFVLLIFGTVLNGAILWLIYRKRALQTVTNQWVASLCTSQLLTCLCSLPVAMAASVAGGWPLGGAFCQIYGFYTFVFRTVSILSVAGIALDRYHVISRPFSKRMHRSSARLLIVFTWWSAIVLCAPPLSGVGRYRYSPGNRMCGLSWLLGGSALVYTVFYVTSVYVITLVTVTCSYRLIYHVTRVQAQKHNRSTVSRGKSINQLTSHMSALTSRINNGARLNSTEIAESKKNSLRSPPRANSADNRATNTIVLVVTFFVTSWAPYFCFALFAAFSRGVFARTTSTRWAEFIVTWLSLSTCLVDPLLYGAFTQNFKKHLRELFGRGRGRDYFETSTSAKTNNFQDGGNTAGGSTGAESTWRTNLQHKFRQSKKLGRTNSAPDGNDVKANDVTTKRQSKRSRNGMTSAAQNASFVYEDFSDFSTVDSSLATSNLTIAIVTSQKRAKSRRTSNDANLKPLPRASLTS